MALLCFPDRPRPLCSGSLASGRPGGACTHWGGVGTGPTVVSSTAQPLGRGQAFSATEGPRVAQLAVLHTGSPFDLSESTLGREKDITKVKVLEARVGALQEGNRAGSLILTLNRQARERERDGLLKI